MLCDVAYYIVWCTSPTIFEFKGIW